MSVVETPLEVEQAAAILERAADLLEEFGWCQGRLGGKSVGEMCLMGAMYEAMLDVGVPENIAPLRAALLRVGVPVGVGTAQVANAAEAEWNDEPGRTKAEVVAKLREAAAATLP